MAKSSCWTSAVLRTLPSFSAISTQAATDRFVYFVFDLLYLDGVDLRSVPLIERKRLLAHVLRALPVQRVRIASHVEADGAAVFKRACEMQIAASFRASASRPIAAACGTRGSRRDARSRFDPCIVAPTSLTASRSRRAFTGTIGGLLGRASRIAH